MSVNRRTAAPALIACGLLCSCAASHRQSAATTVKPALVTALNKQIINAVEAGDGDYQLRILRARLDADPRNLSARLELADRYRTLGFTEVAIEHCRLACERAPDSDEAHIALAKALRDSDRTPEALAELAGFAQQHESAGARVWAWIGILHDDREDWKAGETAHRKALALDRTRDEFHNNLGYCLLRQGRNDEAAQEFRAALALHPHSAIAENNLALALAGHTEAASREAVARMQSVADPASAHNNMAVALIEAGKYAEAQQEITLALGYNRSHPAALSNLQLLADLEGHPAQLPALTKTENRWARAWRRLRNPTPRPQPGEKKTDDSGSQVASR